MLGDALLKVLAIVRTGDNEKLTKISDMICNDFLASLIP